MTLVSPFSIVPVEKNKSQTGLYSDEKAVTSLVTEIDECVTSSDAVDALKLVDILAN